jgi:acetylornithine deacetylase/succinyl-diaminopimelate desuccinylase-like protein
VIFGPDGEGAHSVEEWVSLPSIIDGARILASCIAEFCG